jgi:glycosyltransferase involved in cell wall biosynthesis
MRVCFVTGEYPPMQGGVGDCTYQLGCALLELGHQVVVVTSTKAAGAPTADGAAAQQPEVRPVVDRWNWASWGDVLQTAQDMGAGVVHIQYQTAAYALHPAVNLLPLRLRLMGQRPPVLVTFHDLRVPYLFPKAGVVRVWANRVLARWSDAAIATNVEDYQQLKAAGLPADPYLIPIGSNIHPAAPQGYDRQEWRHSLGVADDETLLCYFGFLNASKGGETLFRGLSELLRRGWRAKLLMIGGQVGDSDPTNRAYLERVKTLGQELGVTDQVLWTGYMPAEHVSASFWAADICVLPYRDGVSYRRGTLMAALAHGLPIVSTEPSLPMDTLVHGHNILLVNADNPGATADAVERLIAEPALRTRLAQGALELAQNFTWQHIATQTLQLYEQLSGGG